MFIGNSIGVNVYYYVGSDIIYYFRVIIFIDIGNFIIMDIDVGFDYF